MRRKWQLLVLAAFVGLCTTLIMCARPYQNTDTKQLFRRFMEQRLGVVLPADMKWQLASFDSEEGSNSMAVIDLGARLVTADGEFLPIRRRDVELRALYQDNLSVVHEPLMRSWIQHDGYRHMTPVGQKWFRDACQSSTFQMGQLASEYLLCEHERVLRGLRKQWRSWESHERCAASLFNLGKALGAERDVMDVLARMVEEMRKSQSVRHSSETLIDEVKATVMSEMNAVGDWHQGRDELPGLFSPSYGQFERSELAVMAEFWDSEVWTRDSKVVDGVFRARTLGEKVRARAASMTGIRGVSRVQFLEWVRDSRQK